MCPGSTVRMPLRSRPGYASEWNVVVEVLFASRRRRRRRLIIFVPRRRTAPGATIRAAAHASGAARAARTSRAARPAAQHLHVVRNDLGGKPIISLLVLPFSGSQFTLDEQLGTLAQIFGGNFAQTPEQRDAVPFGAFLLRTRRLILPRLAGGDSDVRDCRAARHGAGFRVCAEVADQNHLVYAARHVIPPEVSNLMPGIVHAGPHPNTRLERRAYAEMTAG